MAVDAETQKLLDEVAAEEAAAAKGQPASEIEGGTETDNGIDHVDQDDDDNDLDDADKDGGDGDGEGADDADAGKKDDDQPAADDDKADELDDDDGMTLADFAAPSRVDELKTKEQEVDKKLEELDKKFEDGEVTSTEYNKQMRALNRELTDVVSDRKAEELRVATVETSLNREWGRAQKEFFKEHPGFQDPKSALYRALDAEVRAITADPDQQKLTFKQVLNKAHKQLASAFGQPANPKKTVSDQPAKDKTQGKNKAAQLPPSLDDLPSGSDSQQSEFAHLDKLKGAEYSKAFNKLSLEQQNRYLAGS